MNAGLIVVAAGSSERMGGIDKVWAPIGERPMLFYSLRTFSRLVQRSVLVVRKDCLERARMLASDFDTVEVVAGGAERYESVQRGLDALGAVEAVAVHDAARPFTPARVLVAGLSLMRDHAGAVPVLPAVDTLKYVNSAGIIDSTLDRASIRIAQTPQIFGASVLRSSYIDWKGPSLPTDDSSVVEHCGHNVHTFSGAWQAFKITTERDLQYARLLFREGLIS